MEVRGYLFNYYNIVTNSLFIFIELYTLTLKILGEKKAEITKASLAVITF
jgi:hypothetical protein